MKSLQYRVQWFAATVTLLVVCVWSSSAWQTGAAPGPGRAGELADAWAGNFRISGTMVDAADGRPLTRARVTISLATPAGLTRTMRTGSDGRFAFEKLAAGKYALSAQRRGYAPQLYKQHETYSTAIVVGPHLDGGNIRFALHPGGVITGRVVDEANEPVRTATVRLQSLEVRDGERRIELVSQSGTDDEGRYRFAQLEPGTYLVSIAAGQPWYAGNGKPTLQALNEEEGAEANDRFARSDDGNERGSQFDVVYRATYFLNAFTEADASSIQVHAGETVLADLALYPVPSLHVVVNNVRPGSTVAVVPDGGVNAEGFSNQVAVGKSGAAELSGFAPGPATAFVISNENGEAEAVQAQSLELSSDTLLNGGAFSEQARISGVVRMNDGSPLPAGLTLAVQGGEQLPGNADAQVDADGRFSAVGGAGHGRRKIVVSQPAGAVVVGVSAKGVKVDGQELLLGGEKEVEVSVTIAIGEARVDGAALQNGKPVEAAMMLLVPLDFGGNMALCRRDESDSDGTFTFGNVVAGKYVAVAIADGWDLEWSRREVLEKYLARGTKVEVGKGGVEGVKVEVQ